MKQIIILLLLLLFQHCTHHTTSQQYAMPPEITAVNQVTDGYEIIARVMNPELLLAGYSLHSGSSAQAASENSNRTNCSSPSVIPNAPIEYTFEVNTTTGVSSGKLCKFSTTLTAGDYIVIKTLLFSIKSDISSGSVVFSPPSNAAKVP